MAIRFEHTRAKIGAALRKAAIAHQIDGDVISTVDSAGALESAIDLVRGVASSAEQDAIRAVVIDADRDPTPADYLRADSLTRLAARYKNQWLIEAIQHGDPTSFFQPIFEAKSDRVYAYEALLRVPHDGGYVGPGEAFRVAGDQDLSQYLDRVARETAIASASRAGIRENIFINFLPSAIYDPRTCLASTVAALESYGIESNRIVFEVVESDRIHDPAHLRTIVDYYREKGFRVALDDLGSGYSSFTLVNELHPDFVKLDMALVQDVDRDPYKSVLAARLIDAVRELGIRVIAEGIEREEELAWAREHGVDFVQGYLLGRPAPGI